MLEILVGNLNRGSKVPEKIEGSTEILDAVVVGAGVTGLYQLYRLLKLDLNAKILEAGGGVGGTWYWNRYPGARFDSESISYQYSFSEELLEEWDWSEHYSGQPENERYLNFMADKFSLKPHIRFNSRVKSAIYNEDKTLWEIETEDGHKVSSRFFISAVGILSATHMPNIEGINKFKGESFHTSRWPHKKVDFAGKRVGVIGTGATAIQLIPEIAAEVEHLTVFQRTANYACPLRNSKISDSEQEDLKKTYPEVFERCARTFAAFMQEADPRNTFEVSEEERQAFYEEIWAKPGFYKWFGNFQDSMTDDAANEEYAKFVRGKIKARVDDPAVADLLTPTDHPFGSKRIPLETNYYEVYNQDNVLLVDLRDAPIEKITDKGVKTTEQSYDLDVIIYATGFDAITGELTRMDIRGEDDRSLKEAWADGVKTFLTFQTSGFPNLFLINGTVFCNFTRCAEVVADWVGDCIDYMNKSGYRKIGTSAQSEEEWTEYAESLTKGMIFTKAKTGNWFMGTNIEGKKEQFLMYAGGAIDFREKCKKVVEDGYKGFDLS